jgi:3-(3-hydroxy-phenyl)propionate hydroxylase
MYVDSWSLIFIDWHLERVGLSMSLDEVFDVVVAGYGPTGMAAASLLAKNGHRVCVFERWPTLYGQPRMATIDGETARIIQAASNIEAALANSVGRPRYLIANEFGEILIDHDWDKNHVCGFPYRISLHQPDIEDAMDAAARSQGAEVNQGWEVVSVTQDTSFVSVTAQERRALETGEVRLGQMRTVKGRYLIGADGARSIVREGFGIGRESWPFRGAWLTFDATRKRTLPNFFGVSPNGKVAAIFCAPEGRAHSIIPLGTNHIRFNFEVAPDTYSDGELHLETALPLLKSVYGLTVDDIDIYRQAVYTFEGKLANSWRVGRVFLAGDAAHVMTPFQGQGGCSGLRDAINLTWKMDLVLKELAPDSLLNTYESERKPDVRSYVEGSDSLGAMIFTRDPAAAAERDRNILSRRTTSPTEERSISSGILYRADGGLPRLPAGCLGPQGIVQSLRGEGRFDEIAGAGFQLIGWQIDPANFLNVEQLEFLRAIGAVVCGITDEVAGDGLLVDIEGTYQSFCRYYGIIGMIQRPDFIIFGTAQDPMEFSFLVDELGRQLSGGA